uniref:Ribonuclease H-like domain, reverse transcriptase, RNA-dependent DNA polymerase n=1 Tax=Tanacetum cinerariifolium TaxID=118510 RepID=A0A699UZK0_TANCI|nr:ribonuclease H-like domain, reverse transcriptase, RNA-dependent DNA polymerase [Tanacetum cinerariifolium]
MGFQEHWWISSVYMVSHLMIHKVHPHVNKDIGIVNSGCSRSMTGNKEKLDDFVQVVLRIPRRHDLYTSIS